jgi:hypothetical protein
MSYAENAIIERRLADEKLALVSAAKVREGERFFVVNIGLSENHLFYSGTFKRSGDPEVDYQQVIVQFDGEQNTRCKSPSTLGIGPGGGSLVCLPSLDVLNGSYTDIRPAHQRVSV